MAEIKAQILKWVKEIEKFKKKNKDCRECLDIIRNTGDKIGAIYPKIHNEQYESQEEMQELMMQISLLAEEKRTAEKKYKEIMSEKFQEFKKKYENIYDLATSEEGLDQQTLNHVLGTFVNYKEKKISHSQGMNHGIAFMKKKFNLPDDFLNEVAE